MNQQPIAGPEPARINTNLSNRQAFWRGVLMSVVLIVGTAGLNLIRVGSLFQQNPAGWDQSQILPFWILGSGMLAYLSVPLLLVSLFVRRSKNSTWKVWGNIMLGLSLSNLIIGTLMYMLVFVFSIFKALYSV